MGSGDPISSFHRPHGRGDSPGKGNIDFDIMGVTEMLQRVQKLEELEPRS
jgi:hypothetical protein